MPLRGDDPVGSAVIALEGIDDHRVFSSVAMEPFGAWGGGVVAVAR